MKNLFVIALVLFSTAMTASTEVKLPEIREVLKQVESNHNAKAVGDNGASYGILQIKQIAIDDVNQNFGTNYKHKDAFIVKCAEEIFDLYITLWSNHLEKKEARNVTPEDIVRIWNGGPIGYKKRSTIKYFKKYVHSKNKTYICNMEIEKPSRKCLVGGELGLIIKSYTHTQDVFMFKSRKTKYGVHRRYVKLVPMTIPHNVNQYKIHFG